MRTVLAALTLMLGVAACSDLTGPGAMTGTYELEAVNAQRLPFVADQSATYRLELARSTLTLNRDSTYTSTFTWRETIRGSTTTEVERYDGTYSRSGDDLYLYDSFDGSRTEAYFDGRALVVYDSGLEFEYRR